MKPQLGIWRGTFVARFVSFPISITLEEVNDDGTLYGRFEVLSDEWEGANEGEIQNGSYSAFGAIHLEQENAVPGTNYHDRIKFDGLFDVPDNSIGAMWGTVLISRKERGKPKPVDISTGSMSAVFAVPELPGGEKFSEGVWN